MHNVIKKGYVKEYIIIILIALIIMSPLLMGGLIEGHDSIYHVTRAIGTETSLLDGQFPTAIASNFANGFGYSWDIFYPPLANYIMIIFKLIVGSYSNAMNILIILTVIISGIAMFNFIKEISDSRRLSLLTAIIYMTAPYRLIDIYIRSALGEILAFMFLPFIFHGLFNIFYKNCKKSYLFTFGTIGLLLSHNISALLVLVLCTFFVMFNIKKLKDKTILKNLIINCLLIFLIVSYFYLPLFQNKLNTNYACFNERMPNLNDVKSHGVYISQLLFGKVQKGWSETLDNINNVDLDMCILIGLQIVIPLLFTPFVYKKLNSKYKKEYIFTIIVGLLFLVATLDWFPWQLLPRIFGSVQFSFRLLLIASFLLSIVSSVNIYLLFGNINKKYLILLTAIIILYIAPIINLHETTNIDESKYFDTEHIDSYEYGSDCCAMFEYFPSNTYNNLDYFISRTDTPIIINGTANIENYYKSKSNMNFDLYTQGNDDVIIELPYIYYLGYNSYINGTKLNITESENGFLQIVLPPNISGKVTVNYTGTKLQKVTSIVSILSFITYIAYLLKDVYMGHIKTLFRKLNIKNKIG